MTKKSKRRLRRYVLHIAVAILAAIAILLFLELQHISKPPLDPIARAIPSTNGAKAIWRFSMYGSGAADRDQFFFPFQAVQDSEGRIFISDTGNSRIMYFDKNKRLIGTLRGSSDSRVVFEEPLGMAFAPNGDLYVADRGISKIIILDKQFRLKGSIAEAIPILPVISTVEAGSTMSQDRLYVASYDSVSLYTLSGKQLSRWGKRGREPGQYDFPNGLVPDEANNIVYVADSNNHRLQAIDINGKPLWSVGRPVANMNERPLEFDLPAGLARDDEGFLYLVDTFDATIRILNDRGEEIANIGDFGTNDGLFAYPVSITYTGNHRFLIADRGNGRIQAIDIYPPGSLSSSDTLRKGPARSSRSASDHSPGLLDLIAPYGSALLLLIAALLALGAALVLRRGNSGP